ncbi:MAG: hypothetical protein F4X20_04495 [Dehalococcoidia bacterium]|nr:hypothetical protein [Dehalococcoidia bacterium]
MASRLTNLSHITVSGKVFPPPQLFQNIPMLHRILEQVLEDWLRAVEPYQRQIENASSDSARLSAVTSGFAELQPSLLKSLFSYAFFFVAADNAYTSFYSELNRANNFSGLRLKHCKPPRETSFVRKVRMIRNIAIAHFPSKEADAIDAFAAMSWQPMALSWSNESHPDLEQLTFAPGRFRGTDAFGKSIQSQDFEVPGVKTMHYGHCLPYLDHYDEVCSSYLETLQAAMS